MLYGRTRRRRRPKAPAEARPTDPIKSAGPSPKLDNPYLRFALRWWWLILLTTALGALLAVGYLKLGFAPYESTAVILVPHQADVADNTLGNPNQARSAAGNFAAQAASPQLAEQVSRALPVRYKATPVELLLMVQQRKVEIRAPTGSNLITVKVVDSDPNFARTLADTYAAVFVDDVNRSTTLAIERRKRELETRIAAARDELVTAQRYQLAQNLNTQLQNLRQRLLELQATYQTELQRQIQLSQLGTGANPQLAAASANVQTKWLQLMAEQQRQLEAELASVTEQLNAVQKAIAAQPGSVDPTVAAALTTAYEQQLLKLSQDYADLQLNAGAGTLPLSKYGTASEPIPAVGLRLVLLVGVGTGFAAGVAIAYSLDIARRYGLINVKFNGLGRVPAAAWGTVRVGAGVVAAGAAGVILLIRRLSLAAGRFIGFIAATAFWLLIKSFLLLLTLPITVGKPFLKVARVVWRRLFPEKRAGRQSAVERRLSGLRSES